VKDLIIDDYFREILKKVSREREERRKRERDEEEGKSHRKGKEERECRRVTNLYARVAIKRFS
jgi:hypothetical protein